MQGLCNSVLSVNWLSNSRNQTFFGYVLSGTEQGTDFFGYFDFGFSCFGLVFGSRLIMPTLRYNTQSTGSLLQWPSLKFQSFVKKNVAFIKKRT